MTNKVFVIIWMSVIVYVVIGALIFVEVEEAEEHKRKTEAKQNFISATSEFLGEYLGNKVKPTVCDKQR